MKNFKQHVELASKMEDLNKLNRKHRRFLATVTRKIVDTGLANANLSEELITSQTEKEN